MRVAGIRLGGDDESIGGQLMTDGSFCPNEASSISDPVDETAPCLGEASSEMSPASEPEASAPGASWDLAARPPNCS